jgi:hypothetical protein
VLLFIDRLPLYTWVPPGTLSPMRLLSASLPVLVSDPGSSPRSGARPQRWAVDTRFTGEAYAWRHHLEEAGLNPNRFRGGITYLTPLSGAPLEFPLRRARLWLVSNIPALRGRPYHISLSSGIALRDVPSLPNPQSNCPLLGMRALELSGLKITIDFTERTVSVWVPGPWYRRAWWFLRRLPSGFATAPVAWE